MRRDIGWTHVGLLCMGCAMVIGCAGGERHTESPESAEAADAPEDPRTQPGDLDVDMSFGDDEDADAEEERRYGRTPPPTRTYSPGAKMSKDEKPGK